MAAFTEPRTGANANLVIGFDADDTLWHNEIYYRQAAEKFKALLAPHKDPAQTAKILSEIEIRYVAVYGYGFKSYTLSMIEAAIRVTEGRASADVFNAVLDIGCGMLSGEVLLFEHVRETLTTTMQGEQSAPAADPNDYTVAADGTIRVQEGEALVHFATWLDTDAAALRTLNGLRSARLRSGQRLRLDFTRVRVATFEERRVDHHRELQERFFARYRIAGTNEHVVRRGESIWVLAERRYKVPIWLLRQYNPDIDLAVVKPGSRIVVPRLESRRA